MKVNSLAHIVLLLLATTAQTIKADFFVNSGAMNNSRYDHTATVLTNGQVLVAGGEGAGYLSSAELYDVATGVWTNTGNLQIAREGHTATLLFDGCVLVAGGIANTANNVTTNCELYNPTTKTWSLTGATLFYQAQHTATLLQNGKVLITGGWGGPGNYTAFAEIYNPVSGTWSSAGQMTNSRISHTATLLNNGKVLVAGGSTQGTGPSVTNSAELYDPANGTWNLTGSMNKRRAGHSATLLPNGMVLVAGGTTDGTISAELYNPDSGSWTIAGNMVNPRSSHTATLLKNGLVLVIGGYTNSYSTGTSELYDLANNVWIPAGSLLQQRGELASVLLTNGCVLATGGYQSAPYYNILSSTEIYYPGSLPIITSQPQPTIVTNGHTASFSVAATGISPLGYQWYFNGTNLLNSTNTTLTLQNAFPANAGAYAVAIASTYGSVTSNPAMLTVLPIGITTPKRLANGQFQFSFDTAIGVNYAVQYSTNLFQWFPFVTLGGIGVPLTLIDPNAASSPQHFYRVSLTPQ